MSASEVNEYVRASLPDWRAELEERNIIAAAVEEEEEDHVNDNNNREGHATYQQPHEQKRGGGRREELLNTAPPSFEVYAHLEAVTDSALEPTQEVLARRASAVFHSRASTGYSSEGPLRERGWAEWLFLSRRLTTDSSLMRATVYNEPEEHEEPRA